MAQRSPHPGTATKFGLHNFIPNGNRFKLNYELILIQDGIGLPSQVNAQRKSGTRSIRAMPQAQASPEVT